MSTEENTPTGMAMIKQLLNDESQRKTVIGIGVVVLVVLISGMMFLGGGDGSVIPSTVVKKGDVTIKITEIGELRALEQTTISAITDKLIIWLVPEGIWVNEGDTLVVFESEKYAIASLEASSIVDVAKADVDRAMSDLEAQQAKEEGALKNYESLPELAAKGFVMESEVEQARLTYIELKSKSKSYSAAVVAAEANLLRTKRGLSQKERKLRASVMFSPASGLVVYASIGGEESGKKVDVGMIPYEGQDLLYLPNISSMQVDAEINEVDLSKVQEKQPVRIMLDAYPDDIFSGEVSEIATLAKRKISRVTGKPTGAKVFDVVITVLEDDPRLKPGLTATADVIVNEYKDILYVSLEAIFFDELDETIVYVKDGGSVKSRKVVIKESNDRVAVISEGLNEGEEILMERPTSK